MTSQDSELSTGKEYGVHEAEALFGMDVRAVNRLRRRVQISALLPHGKWRLSRCATAGFPGWPLSDDARGYTPYPMAAAVLLKTIDEAEASMNRRSETPSPTESFR